MKYSLRNFTHIVIQGQQQKLLPTYIHIEKSNLQWLNDNSDALILEFCRLVAFNIDDIEKKSLSQSTSGYIQPLQSSLVCGSNDLCFVYCIDTRPPNHSVISYSRDTMVTEEGNHGEMKIIAKFTLLAWLYPISQRMNLMDLA